MHFCTCSENQKLTVEMVRCDLSTLRRENRVVRISLFANFSQLVFFGLLAVKKKESNVRLEERMTNYQLQMIKSEFKPILSVITDKIAIFALSFSCKCVTLEKRS